MVIQALSLVLAEKKKPCPAQTQEPLHGSHWLSSSTILGKLLLLARCMEGSPRRNQSLKEMARSEHHQILRKLIVLLMKYTEIQGAARTDGSLFAGVGDDDSGYGSMAVVHGPQWIED
ncbi:hypothetical protein Y1Q_0006717 [Alligator mississippiensis]|uniref:Uncharacterized protein n=1 Tax=Alligator mississippiensis TaxID=8496 RepID=A0A151NST0_ALLMI|nr:hypothetical protein Y1Q_0006717 [Alligator mississippiensis]